MKHSKTQAFYFDLSELYFASSARLPYYGIARTVREVARALIADGADVEFVVYSPLHRRFFKPTLQTQGACFLDFPQASKPWQVRRARENQSRAEAMLRGIAGSLANVANRARWNSSDARNWTNVDLNGGKLVSFARPKIMSAFLLDGNIKAQFYPMLHDLIPLHELSNAGGPKFARSFLHDTQVTIRHATRLLANSHFTHNEIEAFSKTGLLGVDCPPISTVQLAHEMPASRTQDDRPNGREDYFLCVGAQTGRKNVEVVLRALRHLHEQGRKVPNLVLAGAKRKRTVALLESSDFAAIRNSVTFHLNPDDTALAKLYAGAEALIMPSKMEGWGLPVGEALWLGTPALAANTPALKEVGWDAAMYFDADDHAALANLLSSFDNTQFVKGSRSRVQEARAGLRSWKRVARDLADVLK